jgi:HKD family nuclease
MTDQKRITTAEVQILLNERIEHSKLLRSSLAQAHEITICVAFMKHRGITHLLDVLSSALQRRARVTIVAGLDFYLTEPAALEELYTLLRKHRGGRLLIADRSSRTYHPKVYLWSTNEFVHAVIGSANCTDGGLRTNVEASAYLVAADGSACAAEWKKLTVDLAKEPRAKVATRPLLSRYAREYETYHARVDRAQRAAERAVRGQFQLDPRRLSKYLRAYRLDQKQQKNRRARVQNYHTAKRVLNGMLRHPPASRRAFLQIYESLVGAPAAPGWWHSGGLFRSKNRIADNYRQFLRMLREVPSAVRATPEVAFDRLMAHARRIKGLGVNVVTEILNTYAPRKFAVLNENPVGSLERMGFERFGSLNKTVITAADYARFNELASELARRARFSDLSHVDHFLNFIYWNYVKAR